MVVCYVFAERSDLSFIAIEGGEHAAREVLLGDGARKDCGV
jgi:hypothetical protein